VQAASPNGGTGSILMLSSIPQYHSRTPRLTPPPPNEVKNAFPQINQKPYNRYYFTEVQLPKGGYVSTFANGGSIIVADFQTSKVIEGTNASSYGHLPSVNALGYAIQYQTLNPYILILGENNASGHLAHIIVGPYNDNPPPREVNGNSGIFYPARSSVTEVLTGVATILKTEQVDYISPSGNMVGDNYRWQGSGDLEPIFKVTNQDAVQTESNNAFLAGIAFGVAGGAAIAVIQEVPKRKRKSDPRPDATPT
jgi:hypothetical protein